MLSIYRFGLFVLVLNFGLYSFSMQSDTVSPLLSLIDNHYKQYLEIYYQIRDDVVENQYMESHSVLSYLIKNEEKYYKCELRLILGILFEEEYALSLEEKQVLLPKILFEMISAGQTFLVKKIVKLICHLEDYNHYLSELRNNYGETLLYVAVKNNNMALVSFFMRKSADVNLPCYKRYTSLIKASACGFVDIVRYLLSFDANIDAQSKDGVTALMLAAAFGRLETVKLLIENRADLNMCDKFNRSALIYASWAGNEETILKLIDAGACVAIRDRSGKTALDYAKESELESVVVLLSDPSSRNLDFGKKKHKAIIADGLPIYSTFSKAYKKAKESIGYEIDDLQLADFLCLIPVGFCLNGDQEENIDKFTYIFECLIKYKGEYSINEIKFIFNLVMNPDYYLNFNDKKFIDNLFVKSVGLNDAFVINNLLKLPVNLKELNFYDEPPLILAILNNNVELISKLISLGANVNHRMPGGKTPLMYAAINGNIAIFNYLVDCDANIEAVDEGKNTALIYAVLNKHIQPVGYLLKKGAKVNHQDINKKTALHYAVMIGSKTLVELLIKNQADATLEDISGFTALDYVGSLEDGLEILQFLKVSLAAQLNTCSAS